LTDRAISIPIVSYQTTYQEPNINGSPYYLISTPYTRTIYERFSLQFSIFEMNKPPCLAHSRTKINWPHPII